MSFISFLGFKETLILSVFSLKKMNVYSIKGLLNEYSWNNPFIIL